MTVPIVTFSTDPLVELGIHDGRPIAPAFQERYEEYVEEEVRRYPVAMRHKMPPIVVVDSGSLDGASVHARYLADGDVLVLTPCYDFRGNVHRGIAAWLLAGHDKPGALAQAWSNVTESARSRPLYSEDVFNDEVQLTALVGALLAGRASMTTHAALASLGLVDIVAEIDAVLQQAGIDRTAEVLRNSPYGYTTEVRIEGEELLVEPGGVVVTIRPPELSQPTAGHAFRTLSVHQLADVAASTLLDMWVLPESVLRECVSIIHVVDDVRSPECDIAGYASGFHGSPSAIVTELDHRQSIFAHELGHAIHVRFRDAFPEQEWLALVPQIGGYFGDAQAFIKAGVRDDDFAASLLRRGFNTSYGSSTFNEDVAEYFESLLTGDDRIWAAAATASLVAAKVDLLITFLHDVVDPALNRRYFEDLARRRTRQEQVWSL